MNVNRQLGVNWMVATKWKETSRYQAASQFDAQRLHQAVTDITDGVLPWIKIRW